jgi:hypothetical protein
MGESRALRWVGVVASAARIVRADEGVVGRVVVIKLPRIYRRFGWQCSALVSSRDGKSAPARGGGDSWFTRCDSR